MYLARIRMYLTHTLHRSSYDKYEERAALYLAQVVSRVKHLQFHTQVIINQKGIFMLKIFGLTDLIEFKYLSCFFLEAL